MSNVVPSDKQIDGHVVLKIADPDSPFNGIEYYYDGMKFADEENDDGSMNMSFEYFIVEGNVPDTVKFEKYIGDTLLDIMMEQLNRGDMVFKGGV